MRVVKNALLSSDEDEDEFKPKEVKPCKKLREYNFVKHEKYGTTNIYVVDEEEKNRPWEKNCTILSFKKSEYGEQKAEVKLESPGLVCAFKL